MTIRTGFTIASMVMIGIWVLGFAPQARAETVNFKQFTHVTKQDMVPVADVEGHAIGVNVREGAQVSDKGEWAWVKACLVVDSIKGAGKLEAYTTITFMDGSTYTIHTRGALEATPQGVTSAAKITGDLVSGTGRFQGIKGTVTMSTKLLTPEKGELGGKAFNEGTLTYTLPGR